jgi:hypothetical protein
LRAVANIEETNRYLLVASLYMQTIGPLYARLTVYSHSKAYHAIDNVVWLQTDEVGFFIPASTLRYPGNSGFVALLKQSVPKVDKKFFTVRGRFFLHGFLDGFLIVLASCLL